MISGGKYPVVSGGTGYMGYLNEYNRNEETITIAQYGTAGYVNWQKRKFWANDVCFCVYPKNIILNKYLYYFLSSKQNYLYKVSNKSAIPYSISKENILKIKISIPSLETQEKIVKILDNFTKYVTELQARNKQYNYYRDMLLSEDYLNKISKKLDSLSVENQELRLTTLGEVGKVSMCRRILKNQTTSNREVPFYKIGTFGKKADSFISKSLFEEYKSRYSFPKKGDILISASGTIGRTVIYNGEDAYFQDSNIVWIDNDETVVKNKYLYYFYSTNPWKISNGGTISRIYNKDIEKIKIFVPPIEIQNKIVKILDRFQELLSDTKGLLPLEIEQRRKQ
ncbi:restriction endonuclease subunit S [Leptotrichia sp. HSP-342]|uniref:Restriction endonuclease subunit S n=1 Tax=Leptotrichia mesophila TaxID=3239303 RepID=A0AB39V8M1_9FUSO